MESTSSAGQGAIRAQIIRRGALIFLFGLLINGFPYFTWGDVPGVADPSLAQRMADRLLHWRMLGVLQRIGIASVAAAAAQVRTAPRAGGRGFETDVVALMQRWDDDAA